MVLLVIKRIESNIWRGKNTPFAVRWLQPDTSVDRDLYRGHATQKKIFKNLHFKPKSNPFCNSDELGTALQRQTYDAGVFENSKLKTQNGNKPTLFFESRPKQLDHVQEL